MAGTVSFGGIGSGIDTEAIVSGLLNASKTQLSSLKSRASSTHAAVSTISDISSLLSKLKTSLEDLDDAKGVGGYKASSASSAIVASANGNALPGAYSIKVNALAQEHRTYSNSFASTTDALGQAGTLDIQVGSGTVFSVDIDSDDSLDSIVSKINATDARVSASTFFDGTNYRIQVRGLDTGEANSVTLTETDTTLGLDTTTYASNTVQQAGDAEIELDGFTINRSNNQFSGVIEGVTLVVTEETSSAVSVSVASDPDGLKSKLQTLVDAYNAVITKVQQTAGFGETKGTNPVLAGDSTLRTVTSRLSEALLTAVGDGTYQTLASIGVSLTKTGTLSLDSSKLSEALDAEPSAVSSVLAGDDQDTSGVMDVMRDLVESFTQTGDGLLALKQETLDSRAQSLDDSVTREEDRLDRYAEQLRKQFTNMDTVVAGYNTELDYLVRLYSGG